MAQTTLERHQAARDAVSADVGARMNEIAEVIRAAVDAGLYVDGLTINLQRAFSAALSVGQELAPRAPTPMADVGALDLGPAVVPAPAQD